MIPTEFILEKRLRLFAVDVLNVNKPKIFVQIAGIGREDLKLLSDSDSLFLTQTNEILEK
jgi:hypothetical protein